MLQENLEFKVIGLRNTWKVYPIYKSVYSNPLSPLSCLYTVINRQLLLLPFLLGYSFTANMVWVMHLCSLDLWKGRCFSVLVTIVLFVSSCNSSSLVPRSPKPWAQKRSPAQGKKHPTEHPWASTLIISPLFIFLNASHSYLHHPSPPLKSRPNTGAN